jgi:hypothetical protein
MGDTESKKRSRSVSQSSPLNVSGSALQSTWGVMGVRPTEHRVPARGTNYSPSSFIYSWPASSFKGLKCFEACQDSILLTAENTHEPRRLPNRKFLQPKQYLQRTVFWSMVHAEIIDQRTKRRCYTASCGQQRHSTDQSQVEAATKMGNTTKLNELPRKLRNLTFIPSYS